MSPATLARSIVGAVSRLLIGGLSLYLNDAVHGAIALAPVVVPEIVISRAAYRPLLQAKCRTHLHPAGAGRASGRVATQEARKP